MGMRYLDEVSMEHQDGVSTEKDVVRTEFQDGVSKNQDGVSTEHQRQVSREYKNIRDAMASSRKTTS